MFQLKSARAWDVCTPGCRGEGLLPPVLILVSLGSHLRDSLWPVWDWDRTPLNVQEMLQIHFGRCLRTPVPI